MASVFLEEGSLPRREPLLRVGAEPAPGGAVDATIAGPVGDATSASRSWASPESSSYAQRRTSLLHPSEMGIVRHGHRVPVTQYLLLAAWLLLLLAQYALVRYVCRFGIPHDCKDHDDPVKLMKTMQYLLFPGFVLAVFTGMHWPDRFLYVFTFSMRRPRGLFFLVIYFGFGIFWGVLDLIPGLQSFSLTGIHAGNAVLLLVLAASVLAVLSWHIISAFRHNSKAGFAAYVLTRLAMLSFYALYVFMKLGDHILEFHLHHYVVGYIAASLAEFNHPVSLILLAGGTAVFVQGLAAYGADGILGRHFILEGGSGQHRESPLVSFEAYEFFSDHCRARAAELHYV